MLWVLLRVLILVGSGTCRKGVMSVGESQSLPLLLAPHDRPEGCCNCGAQCFRLIGAAQRLRPEAPRSLIVLESV